MCGQRITKTLLIGLMASTAWAQAPSSQPSLPPGHPDISKLVQPAASSGSLPAGHPGISQTTPTTNSLGAAGSAGSAGMNLPAGHPDISGAPTQQPRATGTLYIRGTQGTKDGPSIERDAFAVEFLIGTQLLERVEGKLDTNGRARIDSVPLQLGPQPVVKVTHGDVEYSAAGQVFGQAMPTQEVEVPVYETSDVAPAWKVRMHHVMVEAIPGALNVMEMLAIDTPGDHAWIGNSAADGKRVTFALNISKGAKDVKLLSGFQESRVLLEGDTLRNTMPLSPGSTQYQITYTIPATDGVANVDVTAPGPTENLMLFLPDDGTAVQVKGMEFVGSNDMGTGKKRFYRASNRPASDVASIQISGILAEKITSSLGTGSAQAAQIIAGVGAAIILVFAIAMFFVRANPRKA